MRNLLLRKKTLPCLASFLLFETFLKELRFSARIRAGCSGHLRSWDLKFVQFSGTSAPLTLPRVLLLLGARAKNKKMKIDKNQPLQIDSRRRYQTPFRLLLHLTDYPWIYKILCFTYSVSPSPPAILVIPPPSLRVIFGMAGIPEPPSCPESRPGLPDGVPVADILILILLLSLSLSFSFSLSLSLDFFLSFLCLLS